MTAADDDSAGGTPAYEYNEYPKSLAPDDFWGQVRRTRYGKPIGEDELQIIVDTIVGGLDLGSSDQLLDLACGNGALSARLFDSCSAFVGVDASEYLIQVAKDNFERLPNFEFRFGDVADFVMEEAEPQRFTTALCYGSYHYFDRETAAHMLQGLCRRFPGVDRVLIGNVPDKERADLFFGTEADYSDKLSDPTSQIGVWWSEEELRKFAAEAGWHADFRRMPEHVFNANYRFDAVLTRIEPKRSDVGDSR